MRDNAIFGGVFRRHEGFQKWLSRFLKTPKTSERGGGVRRCEGPAAGAGARRRAAGTRAPCATRRFRQRPRQRRRLGRRTRGAQLAKRTHRAAWPYSRARGSAAAAASPRGPSDPPRGGSRSRRRRRGRARCSGRRGGEGSGGGVGRRARAPQRGRRVALPAPRQPLRGRRQSADWRSGARDGRTGSGAFDAGPCVRHSDVAHRSVGCIRAQPCTRCDCHWRRSGHMHRALVAAAAGRRQTASGPARGRAIFCTRASAADAFGAHAHARFPSQDDDDAYARSYIYIYTYITMLPTES